MQNYGFLDLLWSFMRWPEVWMMMFEEYARTPRSPHRPYREEDM